MLRPVRIAAAVAGLGLVLGLAAPQSASAATGSVSPVCNGRFQQVTSVPFVITFTNWKATYLANGTVRYTYDRYRVSAVDFPSTGLGYKVGRYSCTATSTALRPV